MSLVVDLRPLRDADWPLLRGWLARPDIERWWGPKASAEAAIILAMGSGQALCRIVECADKDSATTHREATNGRARAAARVPIGYVHALDATLWGERLPEALPAGTWDIDLFIAADGYRNLGLGQQALQQIRDEVFETTLAVAVCIFAPIANERAVRAYEKAGFRWRGVWNDAATGPSWFLTAERPTGAKGARQGLLL